VQCAIPVGLIPSPPHLLARAQLGIYIALAWFPLRCPLALVGANSLHFALGCPHLVLRCVAMRVDKATHPTSY